MALDRGFSTESVGGVPFAITNLDAATSAVRRAALERRGLPVRLSNAYCVVIASHDASYARLFSAGWTFPDGAPIVLTLHMKGARNSGRVRGPSLFESVLSSPEGGLRHYFLGSSDETLGKLLARYSQVQSGDRVAGYYSPPFAPLSQDLVEDWAARILATDANIVWVSLGTPKQDFAATQLAELCGRTVVAVGAAFDFYAGTTREAPRWMQNSGLEWLFRLVSEPRRLWRRYLVGNTQFLWIVIKDLIRQRAKMSASAGPDQ